MIFSINFGIFSGSSLPSGPKRIMFSEVVAFTPSKIAAPCPPANSPFCFCIITLKPIFFGPDGNDEPEKIPKLIEKIKEGYDQVLVTRFGKGSVNLDAGIIDTFGNKMFAFLGNVFFGGHWTDILNESRIISRNAFNELRFDAMGMSSTQQMSIRGLTRRQKICEIIGNEGKRIGGKRKMHPLSTGASLSLGIIKEFIFWKM